VLRSITVRLKGRVQGVGFRYYAEVAARRRSLVGYAKNEDDGSLVVYAEGEEEKLAGFVEELLVGPRLARVEGHSISWGEARGGYDDFYVF